MGAPLTVSRRLLTVEEYHKIGRAGVLGEDDRIELIDGEMIKMAPIGSRHVAKLNRFARFLYRSVGEEAIISIQNPIVLPPHNEPQPDIALLKPRSDDYETKLPGVEDVLLLIEIADTTMAYDRDAKIPIYARQGIAEVWLLDVQTQSLSIFLDPGPKGYRRLLTPGRSDTITPSLLPNVKIQLTDLW
jgi:Uma2 family endonuclease